MKTLKDGLKNIYFLVGFILGVILLGYVIYISVIQGFEPVFLIMYLAITIFTVISVPSKNTFMFLNGLGIPQLIIILIIFEIVDSKNNREYGKDS